VTREIVVFSLYNFCNEKATMCSLCIVELHVTVNSIKTLEYSIKRS